MLELEAITEHHQLLCSGLGTALLADIETRQGTRMYSMATPRNQATGANCPDKDAEGQKICPIIGPQTLPTGSWLRQPLVLTDYVPCPRLRNSGS